MPLKTYFPEPLVALRLEPNELAIPLLKCLIEMESGKQPLHLGNFIGSEAIDSYANELSDEIRKAITESWIWLERELMLAPVPQGRREWVYVTKRGRALIENADTSTYMRSNIIQPGSLDPILADKALPLFIRGDYDTAVFQAFKEVEIRVRSVANLPQEYVGVDLMRRAFHPENGPLSDKEQPFGEREATGHLFSGAIGLFKNPASHRDVKWTDPQECAELIQLANHLLRLTEKRRALRVTAG